MLDEAQARAYAEADFSEPHGRFVELLRERLPDLPERGSALDLGCGPADVTIRFARAFPGWTVEAADASPAMLARGREAVARSGLEERILLLEQHLPSDELPRRCHDLVISNSLLHHLDDPMTLWRSIPGCVKQQGRAFVMDLLRPASLEAARRLVQRHAAAEPEVLRRDFYHSLRAAYEPAEVRQQLERAGLERLRLEVVSDRHLIVWGTLR
jgi:ubiquinone/menaquinone biosynthesis C-methylase UbiE